MCSKSRPVDLLISFGLTSIIVDIDSNLRFSYDRRSFLFLYYNFSYKDPFPNVPLMSHNRSSLLIGFNNQSLSVVRG